MICGSVGSESRLAKAAGAEPAGQMRNDKLHAVVARSTFPSRNAQNTSFSDHFWKFTCRKSACWCGAKHVSKSKRTKHTRFGALLEVDMWKKCKSKCTKHTRFGALLEVDMWKKCTPLWREAHFQVEMYKAHQVRSTFGSWHVEKVHAVVVRSTFPSQNVQSTPGSEHFWKLTCGKKCTPLWREEHFQVKMYKAHQLRTTFGSWHVEKVHAVVVRSTFPSQNVQSTPPDHFWKLRCQKGARRCGAKHMSKSKVEKTEGYGALLDVDSAPCQKWAKRQGVVVFSATGTTTLHYTPLHFTSLHYTTLNYTTLHSIHYITTTTTTTTTPATLH